MLRAATGEKAWCLASRRAVSIASRGWPAWRALAELAEQREDAPAAAMAWKRAAGE